MSAALATLSTDILILGSGGAGLFAALHAHQGGARRSTITIAVKGLLGKCGCTRMVQGGYNVALAPGDSVERHFMDTIEGGKWLHDQDLAWTLVTRRRRAHPRAGERARLLLRPQSRRHDPPEGVRRPDLRPHGAQGRPHRHRDHQPARRAGLGARHPAPRGASRGRARRRRATARARRRADDRHAHAASSLLRAGEGGAARHRRRADDVPVPHAVGRQELRRPRDGAARRPAAARHGDGAVPSDGPARRRAHAHDRHGARGRAARRRRLPARTAAASASCAATIRAASARRATSSRARSIAEMRAGRATPNGGVYISMAHLGPDNVRAQFKGMVERCADCGFDLAGGLVEVVPTAHYMMGGVEFGADCTTALRRACSPPARIPAACTAPIASAATASRTRPCSAASPATRWPPGSRERRRLPRARCRRARGGARARARRPSRRPRRRPRSGSAKRSTT